jgi:hypothetical protein
MIRTQGVLFPASHASTSKDFIKDEGLEKRMRAQGTRNVLENSTSWEICLSDWKEVFDSRALLLTTQIEWEF